MLDEVYVTTIQERSGTVLVEAASESDAQAMVENGRWDDDLGDWEFQALNHTVSEVSETTEEIDLFA